MKTDHKIIIGVVLVSIVMVIGFALLSEKKQEVRTERLSNEPLGEKMVDEGAGHVDPGEELTEYKTNPPTSGAHWVGVAGAGIKTEPVVDELILHSMEHGAAVVWYKSDLSESDVNRIKTAFLQASGKKIMVPRENLEVPVALTSWGYLLNLKTIDEATIVDFIETNNDRAPESAPI